MLDRLHGQGTGGAAFYQFSNSELRRSANRRSRMRGFHGPDTLFQPIDQRQIVSRSTKDRLAKMYVRLDESRKDGAIFGVDHVGVGRFNSASNGDNPPIPNQQVSADN